MRGISLGTPVDPPDSCSRASSAPPAPVSSYGEWSLSPVIRDKGRVSPTSVVTAWAIRVCTASSECRYAAAPVVTAEVADFRLALSGQRAYRDRAEPKQCEKNDDVRPVIGGLDHHDVSATYAVCVQRRGRDLCRVRQFGVADAAVVIDDGWMFRPFDGMPFEHLGDVLAGPQPSCRYRCAISSGHGVKVTFTVLLFEFEAQSRKHGGQLGVGFCQFGLRSRAPNDAGAGEQACRFVAQFGAADGHGPLAVSGGVAPAHHSRVEVARESFEAFDGAGGVAGRRAAHGGSGV